MQALAPVLRKLGYVAGSVPLLISFLADRSIGADYGVGAREKLRLVARFRRNSRALETLSWLTEHIELASAILKVPRDVEGDVVEAGCYLGGSTVQLSIVCAMTGRRLLVYDSFQGLPAPTGDDAAHVNAHTGWVDEYYEGRFAASLETVKGNVERLGEPAACEYVKGFFDATMPAHDRAVVAAFLDVDFVESLRPCVQGLWPHMQSGCRMYVHEARSLSLVAIFFASEWWREQFGEDAPGFVGAGTGLPLTALDGSELGYALKGSRIAAVA